MGRQILQMKYHPAKKEVEFRRFQSGKEIPIRNDSRLKLYMNKKGHFVLQDHGNAFFDDISRVFDGEKNINIEVTTTKSDYEDLMQMIEYYNEESACQIDAKLIAELPDMNITYQAVKEHGEKSMAVLSKHKASFWDIPLNNDNVKKTVENFSADIQREVDSIKEKINNMGENSVNLCFAGVYSAGKSALINAILGYSILPENIKSETARMFKIQSPKKGDPIRIVFNIQNHHSELIWNESINCFEFLSGPNENKTREKIQVVINKNKMNIQHRQIHEILKALNSDEDMHTDIKIFYPIPLDNEKVQFTIFDTPGTDSNFGSHQMILKDALSEQTHSILIFVAAPDKIEGEGNNALLNYLKEAELKDSKTSIDIGRSLFVINKADSIGPKDRIDLQTAEIKYADGDVTIKLADKKLFFTSAKYAYAAKAKQNSVATDEEDFIVEMDIPKASNPKFGCYYQHNRCATSEYSTIRQKERSDATLKKAQDKNDDLNTLYISSGLYALENEIINYGEKYAAAVKAYAIIDSVDKALSKMNNNAKSLENQNQADINKIDSEIKMLNETIEKGIKKAYEKRAIPCNSELPKDVLKDLRLDAELIYKHIIKPPKDFIEKLLKGWFFGLGKVKVNDKHKKEIEQKITTVLDDFTRNFLEKRQQILEKLRNDFIEDVKTVIKENGELSDEAKAFVMEIRLPEIKSSNSINEFGEMYDSHKRSSKFILFDTEYIDDVGYSQAAEAKLKEIADKMADDYKKDYRESLDGLLHKIETEFNQNKSSYSVIMKAKLEDKKAMEKLREKIVSAATDLNTCQADLNSVIWRAKNNG